MFAGRVEVGSFVIVVEGEEWFRVLVRLFLSLESLHLLHRSDCFSELVEHLNVQRQFQLNNLGSLDAMFAFDVPPNAIQPLCGV